MNCFTYYKHFIFILLVNIVGYGSIKSISENVQEVSDEYQYVSIARVEQDGKIGYINGKGEEVLPVEFDEGSYGHQLTENTITVRKGENWFIYDVQGNLILDLKDKYKYVGIYGDSLLFVSESGIHIWNEDSTAFSYDFEELSFIDLSGKEQVKIRHGLGDLRFEYASNIKYQNGYLRLPISACERCINTLVGFADKSGEVIIQPELFPANSNYYFHEGLLYAANSKYSSFSDTLARFGFVNTKGEWVIDPSYQWDSSSRFVDGAVIVDSAMVKNDSYYQFFYANKFLINQEGERVFDKDIHVKLNSSIKDSILIITKYFDNDQKFALAKTDGSFITNFDFDNIEPYVTYGYYAAKIGEDNFYINEKGEAIEWSLRKTGEPNEIVFSEFVWPGNYENGLALVHYRDGKTAVIDMDGDIVLAPIKKPVRLKGGLIKMTKTFAHSPDGLTHQYFDRNGQPLKIKAYDQMYEFDYIRI